MGRRKKLNIDLNNIDSLQELMQEVYYDACGQIKEAQHTIVNMTNAVEPMDTDDHTKIAKAKTDALKIKDSAIKIKLDVGKLQNEIFKGKSESGYEATGDKIVSAGEVDLDTFSRVREMMKKGEENGGK